MGDGDNIVSQDNQLRRVEMQIMGNPHISSGTKNPANYSDTPSLPAHSLASGGQASLPRVGFFRSPPLAVVVVVFLAILCRRRARSWSQDRFQKVDFGVLP